MLWDLSVSNLHVHSLAFSVQSSSSRVQSPESKVQHPVSSVQHLHPESKNSGVLLDMN